MNAAEVQAAYYRLEEYIEAQKEQSKLVRLLLIWTPEEPYLDGKPRTIEGIEYSDKRIHLSEPLDDVCEFPSIGHFMVHCEKSHQAEVLCKGIIKYLDYSNSQTEKGVHHAYPFPVTSNINHGTVQKVALRGVNTQS